MSEFNPTTQQLRDDLIHLGLKPGGVLLVHTSLRSLGKLEGGAETVVQGLLSALGPGGTLLMPALSYATVRSDHPVFDVLKTPSCVGALTEYFRTRQGTMRSVHPTHSVCATGERVVEMLGSHPLDKTPCGPESPFSKLSQVGGQVLFIGCGLRPNTSMHAIEEHIEPPYLYGDPLRYQIILPGGFDTYLTIRRHNFKGYSQRYDRLEEVMAGRGIRGGQVLQARCYLLDAQVMWEAALAAYRKDPLFFVEPESE